MSVELADPKVEAALLRSAVYEVLAMGFAYPVAEGIGRLAQVGELAIAEAAALSPSLPDTIHAAVEAIAAEDIVELAAEHQRLFSGNVLATPYETEYETDPFAKSRQLADISGFYKAWGVELSEDRKTMADFVGTQLEFMSLLCRKEANALHNGWSDKVELSTGAQFAFLESHLGRWVDLFVREVRRKVSPGAGDAYRLMAALLEAFTALELAYTGAHPTVLKHRMIALSDAEPMQCDPKVAGPQPDPTE